MNKHIVLKYPNALAEGLRINYNMEHRGEIHTIECSIDEKQPKPSWLQLHKFNFTSLKTKGCYSLLFEESKYNKNLDTLLFMDQVYALIMSQANYKID
ncbi:hypothetical protein G5B00_11760 [Parapedobacter sp. SGR-10]|uniref:hypothetical protein n=1 Tax=Parapedobacter sp. SGR-10 TaxID=2710879 RepID=UPI0013D29543|nr:hypothetical protein [Parapedobacter sp. SGR-10]NGF57188.1 hypothetical protein [Parapedobacter sp. SGR-10]